MTRRLILKSGNRVRALVIHDDTTDELAAAALGWELGPPAVPPGKQPAWSSSALAAFEVCPRRFFATRVAKRVVEPESEALINGRDVHARLAGIIQGRNALTEEFEWLRSLIEPLSKAPYVSIEKSVALTPDLQTTGKWASDVFLRVVYDVVVNREGRNSIIIDWKTGKRRDNLDQLYIQASAVLLGHDPPPAVEASFVWLDAREVTNVTITQRQAAEFMAKLRQERLPAMFEVMNTSPKESELIIEPRRCFACRSCQVMECEFLNR